MLKLKLQSFGHRMWRTDSLEKTLMLEKIVDRRKRGWQWMASLMWWTWVGVSCRSWWWIRRPGMLQPMGLQRVQHDWVIELNRKLTYWHGMLSFPLCSLHLEILWRQSRAHQGFSQHHPNSDKAPPMSSLNSNAQGRGTMSGVTSSLDLARHTVGSYAYLMNEWMNK